MIGKVGTIEEKVMKLPTSTGVYIMKNKKGDVIYVGKAKSLRSRVRSYFNKVEDSRYLIRFLLSEVDDLDYVITDTEKEALILENNLIKKHKPKYNVNLKDDKTYFSLRLTTKDRFPRLSLVRKVRKDGARYFGPYSSSNAVKDTLGIISKTFGIRMCTDSNFRNRTRPCLSCQIKRCFAPCCGLIEEESYHQSVRGLILFLEGNNRELLRLLRNRMQDESDKLNFEEAGRIRDQISSIKKTVERQKMVSNSGIDQDVFAFYAKKGIIEIQVMIMRGGRVIDTQSFSLDNLELSDKEVMSSFLKQYYGKDRFIPSEIITPFDVEDMTLLEEWFSEKKGKKVRIHVPQKGEKLNLLKMVMENAKNSFMNRRSVESANLEILEETQRRLHLIKLPKRIECFDISDISGRMAVGSMVTFEEGRPEKRRYRRFKVKTVNQADDYGMMYEVLSRRYKRASEPDDLPDLVMVDGGKGQLNIAVRVLQEFGRDNLDAISLAKGVDREKIFVACRRDPILLPENSKVMLLLQHIRDEAHRFALAYHKSLRRKQNMRSVLEDIPGVGSVRKKALLKHFGSLKAVKGASLEELAETPGMDVMVAGNVFKFFQDSHPRPLLTSINPDTSEQNSDFHREGIY